MKTTSEHGQSNVVYNLHGYVIQYYVDGKFIGEIKTDTPDRENFGYYGRKTFVVDTNLNFGKKSIKKGSTVTTELQMICGRLQQN